MSSNLHIIALGLTLLGAPLLALFGVATDNSGIVLTGILLGIAYPLTAFLIVVILGVRDLLSNLISKII